MPKAFVLINVESGAEEEVLGELKKIKAWKKRTFPTACTI